MTLKDKVYLGLAFITLIGFMGPVATTVVMREARIDQLEKYREEDRAQHTKDLDDLETEHDKEMAELKARVDLADERYIEILKK